MNWIDASARDHEATAASDRGLRIFVAAAEAGSFTAAGERLGIGQPAVSHAVKTLERALGATLFRRGSRGIALTEAGDELARRARSGFEVIDAAVRETASRAAADRLVVLSVSTALATYWLMPRLPRFREAHPDVELSVVTRDTDRDVGGPDADLWIPLGRGPWPGLDEWEFAAERLVAVAAPRVAETLDDPDDPRSLLSAELLHTEERYAARFDFTRWFEAHGVAVEGSLAGQRSNDYSIVLHAALAGQGVALGWVHIVEPLIDAGELVVIGGDAITTDYPFTIAARRDAVRRPGVDDLRSWLLSEAGAKRKTSFSW